MKRATTPRRVLSDPDLLKAAKHVCYEIEMLVYTGSKLGGFHSSPMSQPGGEEKDMALEAFLLHFRNLRAFLCPSLQRIFPSDVIASDFLKERKSCDYGDLTQLAVDKERIDQMLAHLSYSRDEFIGKGEHGWKVAQMLKLMLEQLEVFFGRLSGMAERSWFPDSQWMTDQKTTAEFVLKAAVPGPKRTGP